MATKERHKWSEIRKGNISTIKTTVENGILR